MILLVEDEAVMRALTVQTLQNIGYSVISVQTGEEAVEIVRTEEGIGLILMDIDLGKGMDGTIAAKTILKKHNLPIVFLSSHTDPEVVAKTEKITSYGYVVKNTGGTVLDATLKMAFRLFEANQKTDAAKQTLEETLHALQESEEKFRSLVETSQELIWKCDPQGRFTYLNPAWEKALGYSLNEMIGKSFGFFQDPRIHERDIQEFKRHLAGGSIKEYETFYFTKDGTELTLSFTAIPIYDRSGSIIGTQGTAGNITERKKAENLLRESEERFRILFQTAPVGITIFNSEGTVIECNEQLEKTIGAPRTIIVGVNMLTAFTEPRQKAALEKALRGEVGIFEGEYKSITGGKISYIQTIYSPLRTAGGALTGGMSVTIDITERLRADKLLRENEEKFRSIVQNLDEGYCSVSVDGIILEHNQAFNRIGGFESGISLVGQRTHDFWQNPDQRIIYLNELMEKGFVRNYLTDAKKSDGQKSTILLNSRLVKDAREMPARIETTFIDFTERKRAEGLLHFHSDILQNLSEGINIIRMSDGIILYTNHRFEQMFGYEPGELAGKHISIVNASQPDDKSPEETAAEIRADVEKFGVWRGEILNRRKDGSAFWCQANVAAFEHPEFGTVWISMHEDITARKITEEELKDSLQTKSNFTALVNHELRTPLNVIQLSLGLLNRDTIDEQNHKWLDRMELSCRQLSQIIEDVLIAAKSEYSQVKDALISISLAKIIHENIMLLQTQSRPEIEFRTQYPEKIPGHFQANTSVLNLALRNLLSNALKYTVSGRIEVKIDWQNDNPDRLKISVTDTGIGIPADLQQKIFEPYFQVEKQSSAKRGIGLGLYMVKKLLEQSGGSIRCESEVNKGSTFTFELPVIPCKTWINEGGIHGGFCSECIYRSEKAVVTVELPDRLKQLSLLIVEDNFVNAMLLEAVLIKHGLTKLTHVENGKAALRALSQESPDLILMDLHLSDMTGFELMMDIKKMNLSSRVIAVTADEIDAVYEQCRELGMSGIVAKPISPQTLFDQMNLVMK